MANAGNGATAGRLARAAAALAVGAVATVAGWLLFVDLPEGNLARLLGVVLAVGLAAVGLRLGGRLAGSAFPGYNVAEVGVEGAITRHPPGGLPRNPGGPTADEVVEQIERADDDGAVDALLVRLNTPGGEVVPSDDIRRAIDAFDGPTVAYATDVCASGGYWIAAGCDRRIAREGSIVGSIGVIGSRLNAAELADELGVSYERLAAGEYKDAGVPLKELDADEREYLQAIVDGYYEQFVERVVEGTGLDADTVRDTEAKVYLGTTAKELGLVDELGTDEDAEAHLEDRLGVPVEVREFEPERRLTTRLHVGAARVAHAVGAGVAGGLIRDADGFGFRFR